MARAVQRYEGKKMKIMKLFFVLVGLWSLSLVGGELNWLAARHSPHRRHQIIQDQHRGKYIRDVAVRLEERLGEAELEALAKKVADPQRQPFTIVQVRFFLPSMNAEDLPWATAIHERKWTIEVAGFTRAEQAKLQAGDCLRDQDELIGCWQCEAPVPQRAFLIDRGSKLLFVREYRNKVTELEVVPDDSEPLMYVNMETDLQVDMLNDSLIVIQNGNEVEFFRVQ